MRNMDKPNAKPTSAFHRRRLPHIQAADSTYYVTFCTRARWRLPQEARTAVLEHCLHDHQAKAVFHCAAVMPDHVHLLLTPLRDEDGHSYGLPEILQGIKGASARSVNRLLGRNGPVWQAESFDHILRSEESLAEKVDYVCRNPVRAGLVKSYGEYPWLWRGGVEGGDEVGF